MLKGERLVVGEEDGARCGSLPLIFQFVTILLIYYLTQIHEETNHFSQKEDTESSKAAYKVHKAFLCISVPLCLIIKHPQGFVATFKSLVAFVSKDKTLFLCPFVFKY